MANTLSLKPTKINWAPKSEWKVEIPESLSPTGRRRTAIQPFVLHQQRADVVVGELAILGEHLLHEGFLHRLGLRPQFRFSFAEGHVFGEYSALFGGFEIALDLFQTGGGGGFGEFVLILVLGVLQKTVLAAVFLQQLLQHLPDRGSIGFQSLDLGLLLCKITGHQQGRWQQPGLFFLES